MEWAEEITFHQDVLDCDISESFLLGTLCTLAPTTSIYLLTDHTVGEELRLTSPPTASKA